MSSRILVSLILLLLLGSASIFAQSPLRTLIEVEYVNSDYLLGTGMLGLGDINHDGKPDFAVSAGNIRKTFIYFGGKGVLDDIPDLIIKGGGPLAKGDLNGDGIMDLVTSTTDTVFIFFGNGSSTISLDTIPDVTLTSEPAGGAGSYFGQSIAIGDLNNDGFDDLIVSAANYLYKGKVYVFLGRWLLNTVPDFFALGDSLCSFYGNFLNTGDINGDGVTDLMIGSIINVGCSSEQFTWIEIYYGRTGWTFGKNNYDQRLDSRDQRIYTPIWPNLVDVNTDGKADISFGYSDTAYFFYGRSDSVSHTPDLLLFNPDTTFYRAFNGPGFDIGDINNDGKHDFAIRLNPGGGICLVVYLGGSKPGPVAGRCKGFVNSGSFSIIVPLGDLNGDGVSDFGTTAPYDALGNYPQDGYFIILSGDSNFVTSVQNTPPIPQQSYLSQNYPNPFNPSTTIEYTLPKSAHVFLIIYDATGEEIRKLIDQNEGEGFHKIVWDGRRSDGRMVASGVYYYRLSVDGAPKETKKSLLLK